MYARLILSLALFGFASTAFAQGESVSQNTYSSPSDKTVNVRLAPIQALVGIAMGNVQVAVHDRVSVGVMGGLLFNQAPLRAAVSSDSTRDADEFDFSYNEIGARVDVGLTNSIMSDTWYLSGIIRNLNIEVQDKVIDQSASAEILAAGAVLGYQWAWTSFNMNLGLGLTSPIQERYDTRNVTTVSDEDFESIGTTATLDFNMGLTF